MGIIAYFIRGNIEVDMFGIAIWIVSASRVEYSSDGNIAVPGVLKAFKMAADNKTPVAVYADHQCAKSLQKNEFAIHQNSVPAFALQFLFILKVLCPAALPRL
jgi:hypothetical protein